MRLTRCSNLHGQTGREQTIAAFAQTSSEILFDSIPVAALQMPLVAMKALTEYPEPVFRVFPVAVLALTGTFPC
jgi:hypothetical protein